MPDTSPSAERSRSPRSGPAFLRRRRRIPRTLPAGLIAVALLAAAGVGTAAGIGTSQDAPRAAAGPAADPIPPESTFFSTVDVDSGATVGAPAVGDNRNHGDLWPNCWSDDDAVYGAYGDGVGFSGDENFSDIGVAKITGMPGDLTGTSLATGDGVGQIWNADHNRKPTGMACVGSTMYLAVQDLAMDFNDVPSATVAKSTDHGRTWTWDHSAPMFGGGVFTTVMFLDYGRAYANAPAEAGDYVYAYGLDGNWRDSFDDTVPDPQDLYLARVPKDSVLDRSAWEFVSGSDSSGAPTWTSDIGQKVAVLHDERRVYPSLYSDRISNMSVLSQGGIVYDKPLKRYIYTSWTEYTFEFYESPSPWGPWRRMDSKDFGGYPWTHTKHGGYGVTVPSKYISADGRSMWLQSNVCPCGGGITDNWAYTYSLRRVHLEPYTATTPDNAPDDARNLARESGTVGVQRATHFGNTGYYNDGNTAQSEDDWNDEKKSGSWWGYTWPRSYTMNKVVYTTGDMFGDGGWFSDDLRVQVRRNHVWTDVTGLKVDPAYPYDSSAGPHKSYTLSFDATDGDGVRVIGTPGGTRTFTSVAELAAYYSTAAAKGQSR